MGQQELLITILVTIIIGIAMVIAVDTMQNAQTESNESAVRQDILQVVNDAQVYYKKPVMLGGGGQSFDSISKDDILSINPTNENGSYDISGSGNSVTITGTGSDEGVSLTATATVTSDGMDISWSE